MRFISLDSLDWELGWARVLWVARQGQLDIPDRLPAESIARIFGSAGPPQPEATRQQLFRLHLVRGSKKGGLARTFSRISVSDLVLYQALVDALAADIETALLPRDVVFKDRQSLEGLHDPFKGTPGREAWGEKLGRIVEWGYSDRYAIEGDIAGFYAAVDLDELERILLEVSRKADVVRDLMGLLRGWENLGVRGLPQGVPASAPLGNLYLRPLDRALQEEGAPFIRWMDDFVVAAGSYAEARRILDRLEETVYPIGLGLAPAKTAIRRYADAVEEIETAGQRLERLKEGNRDAHDAWLQDAMSFTDYPPHEDELPSDEQLDIGAVVGAYDELVTKVRAGDLTSRETTDLVAVLRDLARKDSVADVAPLPFIVERVPFATAAVLGFAERAAKVRPAEVGLAFRQIVQGDAYHRELECLSICAAGLRIAKAPIESLAETFGRWAREHPHPLVRARALLVWGRLASGTDFSVADRFVRESDRQWRPYAVLSIQDHDVAGRDVRYERWTAQSGFSQALAREVQAKKIGWRKL